MGDLFEQGDIKMLERKTVYDDLFRLDEVKLRHRTFEGGWTGTIKRALFERGHAVAVLPYDPLRDEVVLIDQFRVGAWSALNQVPDWFHRDATPWSTEIVAGIVEDGETSEDTARREIVEEIGLHALDVKWVRSYVVTPGASSESVILYVAQVDTKKAGGFHGLADENEDIRSYTVSVEDAVTMVDDGRIWNATAIIAIDWLRVNQKELRREWQKVGNRRSCA